MRSLLAISVLALTATAAAAQIRPPTSQRSCGANHQLVSNEGAVVLDTGPSTYARFVRNGSECKDGTTTSRLLFVGRLMAAALLSRRRQPLVRLTSTLPSFNPRGPDT
jgi:hypothetical protein